MHQKCDSIPYTLGGKKIICLGAIRTSIYFHPMSNGQVKKYIARLYFLECPVLFCKK